MAILGIGQKPDVMIHYPHMMAEDTAVWTKFLESEVVEIRRVWYDMRVGMSVLRMEGPQTQESRIAAGLTRKRIDVIASVGNDFWVIEVKPRANMYAVGQVLVYTRLFSQEYVTTGQVISVIVCGNSDEDLLDEFEDFGILVFETDET